MTPKQFVSTAEFTNINGYSDSAQAVKTDWLNTGRSLMRKLAKELGLPKDSFDIRVNPAGPAVSGDVHLHGDFIYVALEQSCTGNAMFYWRFCNGRKDFTGQYNRWEKFDVLLDLPAFAEKILNSRPLTEVKSPHGFTFVEEKA